MSKVFENRDIKIEHPLSPFTSVSSSIVNKLFPFNYPFKIYNGSLDTTKPPSLEVQEVGKVYSLGKICWWQPNQDSIPAEFLESSSMHGLKYVSQPKRHIIERCFWLGAFILCIVAAALMISEIWNRYYENPVIVTFNPTEQDLDTIPFPAVTICNTNPFKRSTVVNFEQQYKQGSTEKERADALEALKVINSLCSAQQSFLKQLKFASKRGEMSIPKAKGNPSAETEKTLTQFLLKNTQPCNELLRFCVWEQMPMACEHLFKPILTDYGKCCTFNMLPQELMEYVYSTSATSVHQNNESATGAQNSLEIEEWKKWDFGDGYILNPDLKFPYRQKRAGMIDGLSLLVDPDTQNSFCPSSDSEGIKVLFHVSLDAPRVADLGSIIGVDREVFMEVNPDLTMAEEGIMSYSHEKRKCYFGHEFKLNFYKPYTRSNCLEECWSNILYTNCKCVLYYTPRNVSTNVCSANPNSADYNCIKRFEKVYIGRLHKICRDCKYSCNDLSYTSEVTYAPLQSNDTLWADGLNRTNDDWLVTRKALLTIAISKIHHRISIIHIFMGSDTVVPKLRQKLYQTVDLIANTGGLLGLSIGFSVLSLVEIIYFATMRICCKRIRKSEKYGPGTKPNEGRHHCHSQPTTTES